jgi:hypothetical protein
VSQDRNVLRPDDDGNFIVPRVPRSDRERGWLIARFDRWLGIDGDLHDLDDPQMGLSRFDVDRDRLEAAR